MNGDVSNEVSDAIQHFQQRFEKILALEKLLNKSDYPEKLDLNDLAALEDRAKLYMTIAQARYAAGDISEHELTFHRCYAIEVLVHESRWTNGIYDKDLVPISEKMAAIEKSYGLTEDEYWPISDAPEEYQALSHEYNLILEKKLLEAFGEFDAEDLKNLYLNDPEQFKLLHDAGRVAVFQKDEKAKLTSIAIYYENEARSAEQAGAFLAASVMLGSAIETRLILKCLDNEKKVRSILTNTEFTNRGIKSKNPITWSLDILINVSARAGWIPNYESNEYVFSGDSLLEFLKLSRNQVHPRKKLKNKGLIIGEEQYKDVKYAHKLISSTLNVPKKQSKNDE